MMAPSAATMLRSYTASIRFERWLQQVFRNMIRGFLFPKLLLVCLLRSNVIQIHSALQRNAATLRKVFAPFHPVMWSIVYFYRFPPIFPLFIDFIAINGWVFNEKSILLGLVVYQMITTIPAPRRWLVTWYPAYPSRMIVNYVLASTAKKSN